MKRVEAPSYPVNIFIAGDPMEAETACLDYCDVVGFCVTVTETTYCYTGGEEADREEERLRRAAYSGRAPSRRSWWTA